MGKIAFGGWVDVMCLDRRRRELWRARLKNGITNQAMNYGLEVMLRVGTPAANWGFLLIDNTSFSAISVVDTYSSHAGWIENTNYSESTRPAWSPAAASGQQISATTTSAFTMTSTVTIAGVALVSSMVKGDSTPGSYLFMTSLFDAARQLLNGSILRVNYTCLAAGA